MDELIALEEKKNLQEWLIVPHSGDLHVPGSIQFRLLPYRPPVPYRA